ncbi:MAG: hypothetical protein RMJ98_18765 [Myxococcales bacterium]|nr:hypothetical protein [Polyangiaceae bacterium]MDW8251343.1 hypothetical protein [Myxococcales bacterium]
MATFQRLRTALALWFQRYRRPLLVGLAVMALGVGPWWERAPRLRVVNPHGEPLRLIIDGKFRAELPPTSTETPGAGVELRLSPGTHRVTFQTQARVPVEELSLELFPNTRYLLVPGESDQCFWVEHTAYGQALLQGPPLRRLPPEQRLWVLPNEIDAWFFPTPPPSSDRRSSGGTRTAVRQARCGFDPWR